MAETPKLIILIPTPGQVVTEFMKSLIGLTQELQRRGITFGIKTYEFSDIVMSRNYLLSYFLSQKPFTHALFLDCDLSFKPPQFFRLLDFDADFTFAAYPSRKMAFRDYYAAVCENEARPEAERLDPVALASQNFRYVVQPRDRRGHVARKVSGDFVTITGGGMGFVLLKRRVPEEMARLGVARPLPVQGRLPLYRDAPEFHDFFSHQPVDGTEGGLYGEDQSFCLRWTHGVGGEIWMDSKAKLGHHGQFGFPGDYGLRAARDGD
ncbi:hypothetical protein [Paracoccus aminophilus]|uniref:Glycosyltransferase n=1 Tax=Paracoccus aminophilus JCM 7686 TaxID=1367847 RepID=S5YHX9_PARAH|nr:hypothetical protein [Paracoccus aminophilus]AGT11053.1 hypothetical protein JCM7686_pAMI4p369 [Paracoccus aminophilus JCM 7686]